jgi:hypothetical protein
VPDTYVVTGTLTDGRTVTLDEGLPLGSTKVRVTIEPLPAGDGRPYLDVVAEIRARQARRGHRPPTREAVDALIGAERADWDA